MKKEKTQIFIVTTMVLLASVAGAAPTFSFQQITNNSGSDAVAGQLSVELIGLSGSVEFLFTNSGPLDSSITDLYFDDGDVSSISGAIGFVDGVGIVSFSPDAAPPVLPNGETYDFVVTSGLSADSDSPNVELNGINPGEQLGLTFAGDYDTVLNDIMTGDLRIGIHVQGIGDNNQYSESYIAPTPVPVPGSIILSGIGISVVGFLQKRRKKTQAQTA